MEGTRSGRPARPPSPKIRGCSSGSAARNGKAGGRGDASAEPHPTASVDGPSGRGSGVVGYNVQVAVDTKHHLIVAHEVMNSAQIGRKSSLSACNVRPVHTARSGTFSSRTRMKLPRSRGQCGDCRWLTGSLEHSHDLARRWRAVTSLPPLR